MTMKGRSRWVYFLPVVHLSACFVSMLGYVIPSVQYLRAVWTFVMLADLPISAVSYGLAWKHPVLATLWIVMAGTLWWYLLSLGAERLARSFRKPA